MAKIHVTDDVVKTLHGTCDVGLDHLKHLGGMDQVVFTDLLKEINAAFDKAARRSFKPSGSTIM